MCMLHVAPDRGSGDAGVATIDMAHASMKVTYNDVAVTDHKHGMHIAAVGARGMYHAHGRRY